jgi:hypothetical protein
MCGDHSDAWIASEDFIRACRDETVRGWMELGCEARAKRELAKHRRKWANRMAEEETRE